jgi:hypothetical protein
MNSLLIAPFTNLSHSSDVYGDASGSELSRARITRRFTGDLEGESTAELLLCKTPGGVMSYAGTDHFTGKLSGRAGSFLFQHAGVVENGSFTGFGYIVPGSATDALTGLRGTSVVKVGAGNQHELHIESSTLPESA